jgi:hypothetical protein
MHGPVVLGPQILYWLIALIEDVTDDFLEHILERDNALDVSVFVDDEGQVPLSFFESPQQCV